MKYFLIILLFAVCAFIPPHSHFYNHVETNDTTYVTRTYSISHDTIQTSPIPRQITQIGTHDSTFSDTSYNVYYNYKLYATVNGSVTITLPVYDTVPAHDTTFTCSNCAVHDTTVIDTIITASADIIYGVFIVNNPQTTLTSRITQANNISPLNTAFRYNYNRGDAFYSVAQIQTSGLLCAMTFNNRDVKDVAYFPTGAALVACAKTFDSLLTVRKPDLVSIENEEGNTSYHKGTEADYFHELDTLTAIAHKHNVAISNGGTTLGIVYALRKWYHDRGRTDSVTWLNNALSLSANSSYGTQQLNWYVPLLADISASQVDYINFHWYEPARATNLTPTTTSGVLPPLINYLRIATGKPVITTEAGTRNTSTSLLFDMFNEAKNAGTKWIIYYDGVGPLAIQNEAGYQAYLNSLLAYNPVNNYQYANIAWLFIPVCKRRKNLKHGKKI